MKFIRSKLGRVVFGVSEPDPDPGCLSRVGTGSGLILWGPDPDLFYF